MQQSLFRSERKSPDLTSSRPATGGGDLPAGSAEAVARAYSVAFRLTGSEADAEDATKEAVLRVGPFDPDRLFRLTVRAVLDLRRTRPTAPGEPAAAEVPAGDRSARLEAAVAALPPAYRDPFVLTDVEGLSAAAVGELLGVSVPAVKSRLHGARLRLCAALRDAA
ncbi:MAG: RNA polymerase sigma factor [Gemmataceae bacterium]